MFTSFDKAIAAVVGAALFFAADMLGSTLTISPELIQGLAALLTPVLVLMWPNLKSK
jgi:hypothetical protein